MNTFLQNTSGGYFCDMTKISDWTDILKAIDD